MVNPTPLISTFITANHILDYHKVLDGFGHLSVRNPATNNTFFFQNPQLSAALVSSADDVVELFVSNASSVGGETPGQSSEYNEKYIHSEILKKFPEVNSVIHSHSEALLPFSNTDVPLRPMLHTAGFLGTYVPVFGIAKVYESSQKQYLLVNDIRLGAALASMFSNNRTGSGKYSSSGVRASHAVVLQRGHGFTVIGASIEQAVYRAIYTQVNARVQSNAMALASGLGNGNIHYLSKNEIQDTTAADDAWVSKPWALWQRQVEKYPGGLYAGMSGTTEAE